MIVMLWRRHQESSTSNGPPPPWCSSLGNRAARGAFLLEVILPTPEWVKLYLKNGKTFSYLRKHHPLIGIGFFTELLILLSNTPRHHINFEDEIDRDYLLDQVRCDEQTARELIEALVKTGKLDRELWEVGIVFMPDCLDALSEFYRRKDVKPPTTARLHADYLSTTCRQSVDNPRLDQKRSEQNRSEDTDGDVSAFKKLKARVGLAPNGGASHAT